MSERLLTIFAAGVMVASPFAQAAEAPAEPGCKLFGSIGTGAMYTNTNAADKSKFEEYRDMSNGVLPNFEFKGRCADNYMNAYGENLGRDDQYMDLSGGQYGVFKYRLYDNELRHRFGSGPGALTPFAGAGGNSLSAAFNGTGIINKNPATWNTFDNSYSRKDMGGMFELSNNSPFYVRFDGNRIQREGIKALSGAVGTSPGQGFMDLPSPVDFTDNNVAAEAGYTTKTAHVAMNVSHNRFTNGNAYLNWTNGFFGGTDTTVLAPESKLTKVALNGNLRQLPYNSVLAGRVTYSKTDNDVPVLGSILSAAGGVVNPTRPNATNFNGDVVHETASLSLNSRPFDKFDTRLYYNFNKKDNRSTQITFTPTAASNLQCGGPCITQVYNYRKNNIGFEGGYRFNSDNKVTAGLEFMDADYDRVDYTRALERKYLIEWKNSSIETLDTRAKYQRLVRTSTFVDTGNFNAFQRRFDLASVDQDLVKVTFDLSPQPLLNLGAEVIFKKNEFTNEIQTLGRTQDERGELYVNMGYGDLNVWRVSLFADAEYVTYDSVHRVGSTPASGNPAAGPAPAAPAVSTSYTYGNRARDKSYMVGLSGDWVPKERWKLNAAAIWMKTQGTVDFTAQGGAIIGAPGLVPISNFDNTTTITLNMKGTYQYNRNIELTGGYAYQHYTYSDIATDNYGYVVGATNTGSMASGLYAFPMHNSNTVYGFVKYKFQ
jgi:hypothetical protein